MCINAYTGVWNAIHSRGGKCCEDELQGIGAFVPPSILGTLASVKPSLRGNLCKHRFRANSTQKLISPHADNSCSFAVSFYTPLQ